MSESLDDALKEQFGQLEYSNFTVDLSKHHVFVCGGEINATAHIPPSFRDRLLSHTAQNYPEIHDSLILAEEFKDYFKDGLYRDLLIFEDDIAKISTLVIIFLESPGSLVELGMFTSRPEIHKKLLIVAPQDKLANEDSFIYLGPLTFILSKQPTSLAIYPWPNNNEEFYDEAHLTDLCGEIKSKLRSQATEQFNDKNSGHLALLVCQIVILGYPLLISDIACALEAMGVDLSQKLISRYLYLLNKLGLVDKYKLGTTHNYYYPKSKKENKIYFGQNKQGHSVDLMSLKMALRQSYVQATDDTSRKRTNALRLIEEKFGAVE